jgi:hypothetical protein
MQTMSAEKTKQVRVSISAATAQVLERLAQDTPSLSQTQWTSLLLDSAAAAVLGNGFVFRLPLRMQITEAETGLGAKKR